MGVTNYCLMQLRRLFFWNKNELLDCLDLLNRSISRDSDSHKWIRWRLGISINCWRLLLDGGQNRIIIISSSDVRCRWCSGDDSGRECPTCCKLCFCVGWHWPWWLRGRAFDQWLKMTDMEMMVPASVLIEMTIAFAYTLDRKWNRVILYRQSVPKYIKSVIR